MGPWTHVAHIESCTPRIDLSNELLSASNGDRMPKLRPREVETPIYPNKTHNFGASSPWVRFLDILGFTLFLNNKYAFEPHCNIIEGPIAITYLLRDTLLVP